jgi:aldose sugar dehydrogenase
VDDLPRAGRGTDVALPMWTVDGLRIHAPAPTSEMNMSRVPRHTRKLLVVLGGSAVIAGSAVAQQHRFTLAPHELNNTEGGPPPIVWSPPRLPNGPMDIESAEERQLRVVVVARELEQPWSVAFLPDGAMLVTERPGRLRVVRNGRLDPKPVRGVPAVETRGGRGLQGLMDVALHPRFAENQAVYLTYHKPTEAGGVIALARGRWTGDALVDVREIFDSSAVDTEASRIAFGRDGMIYMSISAPGSPDLRRAQDPNDYAGKVVRLREDGSIPPDNPFVGRTGYKPGIYTMGHRNGHGLGVNPDTGDIWQTEQGPNGGDELNVLRAGANYGWPLVSFGRKYTGDAISPTPVVDRMADPEVVWLPSIGLTGMTFYTGTRFPRWQGNVFVAGLREGGIPRTGHIQRIVFNDRWEELRREPLLTELKQRMRDVREGPDGLLYVLTAEDDGALLRIEPRAR